MSSSSSSVGRRYSGTDDGDVTIINCMRSFTKEEVLNGDEQPVSNPVKYFKSNIKIMYLNPNWPKIMTSNSRPTMRKWN